MKQITTIVPVGSLTQEYIPPCSVVNSDHDGICACVNVLVERFKPRYKSIHYIKNFDKKVLVNELDFLFC